MGAIDGKQEELFAQLLAEYDAALVADTPPDDLDASVLASDQELQEQWDQAKGFLELLDRVRRHWSPRDAADGTVAWSCGLIDTPADGVPISLGRFEIQRELGRGGLGVVYLAFDPALGRQVALKVPRMEGLASPELRRRFVREAEAAARLNHPHLVNVYEAGEEGAICYIASEYCPGPNLAVWLQEREQPVDAALAARMARELAEAVQHAHGRGVLHRDIKPSNVLLVYRSAHEMNGDRVAANGGQLVPKLTDFGMAKLLESSPDDTRTGAIIGTPAYMAPEQAEGRVRDLDARTDVYGLGTVLYELLTGKRPHAGQADVDVLRRVLFDEPVTPRRLRPEIPRDLEAICLKCLAKPAASRYATAQQLADDLGRFLRKEPTEARPLGATARTVQWARRRPAFAALVAVAILSLMTVLGLVVGYDVRLAKEAARADLERDRAQDERDASQRLLYSADVRLAYEAFAANDVPQTIDLLRRHTPEAAGQEDLREFAWRYLDGQCRQELLTLQGHEGDVYSVEFSPDDRSLATAGQDGTARIWDAATGKLLHTFRGHEGEVNYARFSPDGQFLATAGEDGTIRLWSLQDGQEPAVFGDQAGQILAIAFSPDGQWLASGDSRASLELWNVANRKLERQWAGSGEAVTSVAFSPNGDVLVAGDNGGQVRCLRTRDWQELPGARVADEDFSALGFSPDLPWMLAGAGKDKTVHLWHCTLDGMRNVATLKEGHAERIQSVSFSPHDNALATGGSDGVIRLWSAGERRIAQTIVGHTDRVWCVAWSHDGRWLASSGRDGVVKIWESTQSTGESVRFPTVPRTVNAMAIQPDAMRLVTGSDDGIARVWDLSSGRLAARHEVHINAIRGLRLSADGALMATRGSDGTTVVSDLMLGAPRFTVASTDSNPTALAWSLRGARLATTLDKNTAVILDGATGQEELRLPHTTSLWSIKFSPDGHRIATLSDRVRLWDARTGRLEATWMSGHQLEYSPDGSLMAVASIGDILLVDARSGQVLRRLVSRSGRFLEIAFSRDGKTLAGSKQGKPDCIHLWDVRTGQELTRSETSHGVHDLAFSPNNDRLLAVGSGTKHEGWIGEWALPRDRSHDVERAGEEPARPVKPAEEVFQVAHQPTHLVSFESAPAGSSRLQAVRVRHVPVNTAPGRTSSALLQHVAQFESWKFVEANRRIDSLELGDVNGDGTLDIVVVSRDQQPVRVHTNLGHGTFRKTTAELLAAFRVTCLRLADLDADGALDLVFVAYRVTADNCVVGWCRNDGSGTFPKDNVAYFDRGIPDVRDVVAADFDGDGDLDVLYAVADQDRVVLAENLGDRTFATPRAVTARAYSVCAVEAADLDRDGDMDFVSTSEDDAMLTWWTNDGTGHFERKVISTDVHRGYDLKTADLDGDDDLDVVVAAVDDHAVYWFANDGAGNFGPRRTIAEKVDLPEWIEVADLDADGDLDVLVADYRGDQVIAFVNDGRANYVRIQKAIGGFARICIAVRAADLDQDGIQDVLSSCPDLAWCRGTGLAFDVVLDRDPAEQPGPLGASHDVLPIVLDSAAPCLAGAERPRGPVRLRFEALDGRPLSSADMAAFISELRVYRDSNRSGGGESAHDQLLATVTDYSLSDGILTVALEAEDSRPASTGEIVPALDCDRRSCCDLMRAVNQWATEHGFAGGYPTFVRHQVDDRESVQAVVFDTVRAKRAWIPLSTMHETFGPPLSDYSTLQDLFGDVTRRLNSHVTNKGYAGAIFAGRVSESGSSATDALETILIRLPEPEFIEFRIAELGYPMTHEELFRAIHERAVARELLGAVPTFDITGDLVRCLAFPRWSGQVVDVPVRDGN